MKTLIFQVQLLLAKKIKRDIELSENASLYQLAEAITKSYDFNFDHCFGFFPKITESWGFKEEDFFYELFADLPNVEPTGAKSVEKTKISSVWKNIGDKMMFLFDYGDDWRWIVKLIGVGEKDEKKKYPIFSNIKGEAPLQYPPLEEDEQEMSLGFSGFQIENSADGDELMEYFSYHDQIAYTDEGEINKSVIKNSIKILSNEKSNTAETKLAVITLAHVGTKEALAALENFSETKNGKAIGFWVQTAIGECIMFFDESKSPKRSPNN